MDRTNLSAETIMEMLEFYVKNRTSRKKTASSFRKMAFSSITDPITYTWNFTFLHTKLHIIIVFDDLFDHQLIFFRRKK